MKNSSLQNRRGLFTALLVVLLNVAATSNAYPQSGAPTGTINGLFTVNGSGTRVYFSQGNLQYIGSATSPYWKFADNQWEFFGSTTGQNNDSQNIDRDLFGWGTSGYHDNNDPYNRNYQPWSTTTSSLDISLNAFGYGPSTNMPSPNLTGTSVRYDWGYNAIVNGGNVENRGWRTLTKDEWNYVFNTRTTASGIRYAKANVRGVVGVILLPDSWDANYYTLNNTNTSGASFSSNTITVDDWTTLEQHGVVFLPAAGDRYGTSVDGVGSGGYYWSSSYQAYNAAWRVQFSNSDLRATSNGLRCEGYSVRLVRVSQDHSFVVDATSSPVEGGTVNGASAYTVDAECTLTATTNEGYAFVNWTEGGEVVSTAPTYSFVVTGDRSLVAHFGSKNHSLTGILNGQFSVGEDQQVQFSQGNLQYIGSAASPYWKFADNQWDYLGTTTNQNSSSQTVDRDLFGWGTSGYNHGATSYQPWSTSTSDNRYWAYGSSTFNLFGQADWGYNAIVNGCNQENDGWRTLTNEEWNYIFNIRNTNSGIRYAKAQVNGINGVILLPDDWDADYNTLNNTNSYSASFNNNILTIDDWTMMEQYGAVFLPAAGLRNGVSVNNAGSHGRYWSASCNNSYLAFNLYFYDSNLDAGYSGSRDYGMSVRLVRASQVYSYVINATPSPAEGGTVTGAGAYSEGQTCTLAATANEGYAFVHWTEDGEVVSTEAEYAFTVTASRTLTAHFEEVVSHHWIPATGMSGSMTILGILKIDGVESHEDYYEIGAFCGTECRGSARPELVEGYSVYSLNVVGDTDGELITFRLYDHQQGAELDLTCANELNFEDGLFFGSDEFYEFNFFGKVAVAASADPAEGGTVTGAGSYDHGATATLTATANEGYAFVNWTENDEVVSTEATYSFTVTGDRTLVANFEEAQPDPNPEPDEVVITLHPGWNWISYLLTQETTLYEALVNLTSTEGDLIKGMGASSMYYESSHSWQGSLTTLVPGQGYMYLNNSTEVKTFTYPSVSK